MKSSIHICWQSIDVVLQLSPCLILNKGQNRSKTPDLNSNTKHPNFYVIKNCKALLWPQTLERGKFPAWCYRANSDPWDYIFTFNPQWKVCALLFFTLIHSVAVSKCRKHWKWSWLYQRNTANLHEEKGGKKINISSRILYTNFSLSANQTDWSLKCLTLNVLLKPLGESKGDELHKGYILAWWKVSCWGMRLEAL